MHEIEDHQSRLEDGNRQRNDRIQTAQIEEQLNDTAAAQLLYQQLAQQYPEDPVAAVAKQKIQK